MILPMQRHAHMHAPAASVYLHACMRTRGDKGQLNHDIISVTSRQSQVHEVINELGEL